MPPRVRTSLASPHATAPGGRAAAAGAGPASPEKLRSTRPLLGATPPLDRGASTAAAAAAAGVCLGCQRHSKVSKSAASAGDAPAPALPLPARALETSAYSPRTSRQKGPPRSTHTSPPRGLLPDEHPSPCALARAFSTLEVPRCVCRVMLCSCMEGQGGVSAAAPAPSAPPTQGPMAPRTRSQYCW